MIPGTPRGLTRSGGQLPPLRPGPKNVPAISPEDLVLELELAGIGARELARRLHVSPMWASRRLTGRAITTAADLKRIRAVLPEQ